MASTDTMSGPAPDAPRELAPARTSSPVSIAPGPPLMAHWPVPAAAPAWIHRPRALEPSAMRYEDWPPPPVPVPRSDVPPNRRLPAPRPSYSSSYAPLHRFSDAGRPVNHGQVANPRPLPDLRPSPPQQRHGPLFFARAPPSDSTGRTTTASQAPSAPRQQASRTKRPPIPPRPSPSSKNGLPPQKRGKITPNPVPPRPSPPSSPLTARKNGWKAINRLPPTGVFHPPAHVLPRPPRPALSNPNSTADDNNIIAHPNSNPNSNNLITDRLATINEAIDEEDESDVLRQDAVGHDNTISATAANTTAANTATTTHTAATETSKAAAATSKTAGKRRARKSSNSSTSSNGSGSSTSASGASGTSSVTLPRRSPRKRSGCEAVGCLNLN